MCGIVGIVHPEIKRADPGLLRLMTNSLRHRGPDDEGYWLNQNVGLGMRRLSIIDLEGGHQPLSNEEGNVWTVFNGEIYNFRELQDELRGKGHCFKSRSDTEVIVHLYEEEGENFVQRLRGMFAIALWDARSQKLLLYRDHLGIKPLHYWSQKGTLLFGSEIKALLEYPEVGREISLPALSDYLSFLYIPTPQTIYQEIHKLPAGHFLRWQEGRIDILPYWDLRFSTDEGLSEKEWIEKLRSQLEESVKLQLVSDVPIGAFLSGGIDSSTVVAWMSKQSPVPVKTYSIGFRDERFNELPYARQVAECFKTDHHEQIVEADAIRLLPQMIAGFDEPFADASAIPTYLVSEFARREVTVALSGDGGDELFAGYLWTRKENWLEHYRQLPPALRKTIEFCILKNDYRPLRETGFSHSLKRFIYDAGLSGRESFSRRAMCFQPWMKADLLEPWVQEELGKESSARTVDSLFERNAAQSVMDKFLYTDTKLYLPDDLLTKVDRMSMLHSLEVRVPLLDHQLAELAATIPFLLKQKGRTTKYILKKTMKGILPERILKQRKQGFQVPLDRWFRNELFGFTKKLLLQEDSKCRRFFKAQYVERLLEEHQKGRQRFGYQLYALVTFELWCRKAGSTSLTWKDLVGEK